MNSPHRPPADFREMASRDTDFDGVIRISELLGNAWRRKWQLLALLAISLLAGAVYLQQTADVYQVQARLLVEQRGSALERGSRTRKDDEFLATQAEIIRSPAVVQRAVEGMDPAAIDFGSPEVSPVFSVLESLEVTPVVGTSVLTIGLQATDWQRGVPTLEAIIASYRAYLQESERSAHVETLRVLTESERQIRTDLEDAQQKYVALRQSSPLMDQGREVQQRLLAELGQALAQARTRRIDFQNRMAAFLDTQTLEVATNVSFDTAEPIRFRSDSFATEQAGAGLSNPGDTAVASELIHTAAFSVDSAGHSQIDHLAKMREELFQARIRESELSQSLGPKHAQMKAIRAHIAALKERISATEAAAPELLRQQLNLFERHEHQLETLYADELKKIKTVDLHLLEEQQAQDGIQRLQSFHDSIRNQLREWQINDQALAGGQSVVSVTVLEGPALTDNSTRPPASVLLAVFGLVGLVGGFGALTALERMRDSRENVVNRAR